MHLFVGGTFDRLHDGHKTLLHESFKNATRVTIGITSDRFVRTYKIEDYLWIQSQDKRRTNVIDWVEHQGWSIPYNIVAIDDPYEPVSSSPDVDGLIVTEQNRKVGEEINNKRRLRHLSELVLIEIPLLRDHHGSYISSSAIRQFDHFYLPDRLRQVLRMPLGSITTLDTASVFQGRIITVGDITTDTFLQQGIVPDLAIIDCYTRRKPYKSFDSFGFPKEIRVQRVVSGPGYISSEAFAMIRTWENDPSRLVLLVSGEDDLLVLPMVLFAPAGSYVWYGQPEEGMVSVLVDTEVKQTVVSLLEQFERRT